MFSGYYEQLGKGRVWDERGRKEMRNEGGMMMCWEGKGRGNKLPKIQGADGFHDEEV